jgi:DNA-binding NarL/FixJ family response regulator
MKNLLLPPGIEPGTIEIFRTAKFKADAMMNGQRIKFILLPEEIKEMFEIDLIKNKKALKALSNMFENSNEILEAYVSCRFGNYDSVPDVKNKEITPDMPNCGAEKTCEYYGIICKKPAGIDGNLSKSEIEIIRLIAKGLDDKEIAFIKDISINTVRTHCERIFRKLNLQRRSEVAIWALKHNL